MLFIFLINQFNLDNDNYLYFLLSSKPNVPEKLRQFLNQRLANEVPIEIKPIQPQPSLRRPATEPRKLFWVRAQGHIGNRISPLY